MFCNYLKGARTQTLSVLPGSDPGLRPGRGETPGNRPLPVQTLTAILKYKNGNVNVFNQPLRYEDWLLQNTTVILTVVFHDDLKFLKQGHLKLTFVHVPKLLSINTTLWQTSTDINTKYKKTWRTHFKFQTTNIKSGKGTHFPQVRLGAVGIGCSRTPFVRSWRSRLRCARSDCTWGAQRRSRTPPCYGTHLEQRTPRSVRAVSLHNRARNCTSLQTTSRNLSAHFTMYLLRRVRRYVQLKRCSPVIRIRRVITRDHNPHFHADLKSHTVSDFARKCHRKYI